MLRALSLRSRKNESGNVFMFILIGVALFAALGYSVAKGFRSDTSSTLTKKQVELAADDILTYAQKVSRTVDRLRRNGCSESEISFENPVVSGYAFTTRDKCKVFDTAGGGLTWKDFDKVYDLSKNYHVSGTQNMVFHGENGLASIGDPSKNELIMYVPAIKEDVCFTLNKKLGLGYNTIDGAGISLGSLKFNGTYSPVNRRICDGTVLDDKEQGCCNETIGCAGQSCYHFYQVLIAR